MNALFQLRNQQISEALGCLIKNDYDQKKDALLDYLKDIQREHDASLHPSHLSASNGSIRLARAAGRRHASKATQPSSRTTAINTTGSVGLTWKSCWRNRRVSANAPRIPATIP